MEAGSRVVGGQAGERVWQGGGAQRHTGSSLIPAEWGAGCQARRSPEAAEAMPELKGKICSGGLEKCYLKQLGVSRP